MFFLWFGKASSKRPQWHYKDIPHKYWSILCGKSQNQWKLQSKHWKKQSNKIAVFIIRFSVHFWVMWCVKMWVSVFYTTQATRRKKKSLVHLIGFLDTDFVLPSSQNRFHMARVETFPFGRPLVNGSYCKGSAATLEEANFWTLAVI